MGEKLEFKITAVDEASAVFGGIHRALGGLGHLATGALTVGFGAAVAGIGALGAGLALSIKEAMGAQEIQAQLASVLKSTGGAAGVTAEMANALASELQGITRFSDDAILSGQNLLLTFTGIGKDVFPDTTKVMLDMATAMGGDVRGAAMQLGKALNDPAAGLTALTRVGVVFTDEQKNLIESLTATGDVAGAQRVILEELQKEFGGSAEAAGKTFAGQLDILKNRFADIQETIGMAVLPVLTQLFDNVIMPAMPLIEEFGAILAGVIETLASGDIAGALDQFGDSEIVQNILNFLGISGNAFYEFNGAIETFIQTLMAGDLSGLLTQLFGPETAGQLMGLAEAARGLGQAFIDSLPMIQQFAADMFSFLQEAIGSQAPTIIANLTTAIDTITTIWQTHGETIMAVIDFAWRLIVATVGGAITLLSGVITAGLQYVQGLFDFWSAVFQGDWEGAWQVIARTTGLVWATINKTVETFLNLALSIVGTNLAEFRATWAANWDMAKTILGLAWDGIVKAVSGFMKTVMGHIQAGITAIMAAFQLDWGAVGRSIIDGIASGIAGAVGGLAQEAARAALSALQAAKDALWSDSPSKKFAMLGEDMMAGMAQGISAGVKMPTLALSMATPVLLGSAAGVGRGAGAGPGQGGVHIENLVIRPDIMFGDEYEAGLKLVRYVKDALNEVGL